MININDIDKIIKNNIPCIYDMKIKSVPEFLYALSKKLNEVIDNVEYIKQEGLEIKIIEKLNIWLNDGTIANLINTTIFKDLNTKIDKNYNDLNSSLETIVHNTNGFVSVKSFKNADGNYVKGDGIQDDTTGIQKALDSGNNVIFPNGVYGVSELIIKNDIVIDLNYSTIKRITTSNSLIWTTTNSFTIKNGTIDGQNLGTAYGHLLNFNYLNGDLTLENVELKNNCMGYPTPTKSIDSDLVYIQNARCVNIDNCKFNITSRQGVSLTNQCTRLAITNSYFKDCYLFAFDFEPNTSNSYLCDEIIFENNTVIDCGQKSQTDSVWNSGGFMAITCPKDNTLTIVRNLVIRNNTIKNTKFLAFISGVVAPYTNITQYEKLTLENNYVLNYNRFIIGQFENPTRFTSIKGNYITSNASIGANVYLQADNEIVMKDNNFYCTMNITKKTNTKLIDKNNFYNGIDTSSKSEDVGLYKLKNNITNGLFKDLTSWTFGTAITDKVVSDGWLVVQGGGNLASNKTRWIYQPSVINELGSKFYIGVIAKSNTTTPVFVGIGNGYTQRTYLNEVLNNTLVSSVFTADDITGDNGALTIGTGTETKACLTNVLCFNLTKIFGVGKEPTKEQIDYIVKNNIQGVFHI